MPYTPEQLDALTHIDPNVEAIYRQAARDARLRLTIEALRDRLRTRTAFLPPNTLDAQNVIADHLDAALATE